FRDAEWRRRQLLEGDRAFLAGWQGDIQRIRGGLGARRVSCLHAERDAGGRFRAFGTYPVVREIGETDGQRADAHRDGDLGRLDVGNIEPIAFQGVSPGQIGIERLGVVPREAVWFSGRAWVVVTPGGQRAEAVTSDL